MNILLLETATQVCSVAIVKDGHIAGEIHSDSPNAHSSKLSVFIEQLFKDTGTAMNELDAVCVSSGPGSYTGLRIGVSSAKGICYALNIPLLSVPTLQNMAAQYFAEHPDYQGFVCPMIDARRMECYTAIFSASRGACAPGLLTCLKETSADIIESGIYNHWLDQKPVVFIGDGAAKTHPLLSQHPNALYDNSFRISATGMASLAEQKLKAGEIEDVAYFEPFYLKDFVAKKTDILGKLRDNTNCI